MLRRKIFYLYIALFFALPLYAAEDFQLAALKSKPEENRFDYTLTDSRKPLYQINVVSLGCGITNGSADAGIPYFWEAAGFSCIFGGGFSITISPFNLAYCKIKLPDRTYTNSAIVKDPSGEATVVEATISSKGNAYSKYYIPFYLRYYIPVRKYKTNFYIGAGLSKHTYSSQLDKRTQNGINFDRFSKDDEYITAVWNIGIDSLKKGFHPGFDLIFLPSKDRDEAALILLSLSLKYRI